MKQLFVFYARTYLWIKRSSQYPIVVFSKENLHCLYLSNSKKLFK